MSNNNVTFKDIFLKGAVIFNPVLVQLVGLCPVVAAATNLQRAVVLSAVACIDLITVCVIASAFLKKLSRWARVGLYFVIGLIMIFPLLWYVETKTLINLSLGMKIYIPIIAINSVVAVHCEQFAVKNSVKLAFYDATAVGIGASSVMILVGAIREILGSSSIGGIALNLPVAFKGMTLPFGCLVLLGFMAAGLKTFVTKKYPEYAQENIFSLKKKEKAKQRSSENAEKTESQKTQAIQDNQLTEIKEIPLEELPDSQAEVYVEPEKAQTERDDKPFNPDDIEDDFVDAFIQSPEDIQAPEKVKIKTEEEIDEFFRSLGIDFDNHYKKGDEQ